MRILEAIYEQDFLDCSYGFRPKISTHTALKELKSQCLTGRVQAVFETDIRGFFNHLCHKWLMKMLKVRIGDTVILRLIGKWLKAGALVDGIVTQSNEGTPQGGPISPLLANIYLHYVVDLWFQKRLMRFFKGKAYLTRFADDFVAAFEYRSEAEFFAIAVKERLRDFGLELAEEKTGLHTFGRWPTLNGSTTTSFDFLGFTHLSDKDRSGRYAVIRIPTSKALKKFLAKTKAWLLKFPHANRKEQREALSRRTAGFYNYFGLPYCLPKLQKVHQQVLEQWRGALKRQGQRAKTSWEHLREQKWFVLPRPRLNPALVSR
jgi:group II intron reverse transcriptase/maturase